MDATHLHLLSNHIPILGVLFGVLTLIAGLIWKTKPVVYTGLITFIIVAMITPVVSQSGSGAEEVVEELGISNDIIEAHEEWAELATPLTSILGLLALISMYGQYKRKKFARATGIITLIVAIGVFGLMVQIGNLGGQIRHSEIRKETTTSSAGSHPESSESTETFDND